MSPDATRSAECSADGADARNRDGDAPEPLTVDTVADILSDSHRRIVLYRLREEDGVVPISELVDAILANETEGARDRVHMGLWHQHLPKLDDTGIVEFDRDAKEVQLVRSGTLTDFLEVTARYET